MQVAAGTLHDLVCVLEHEVCERMIESLAIELHDVGRQARIPVKHVDLREPAADGDYAVGALEQVEVGPVGQPRVLVDGDIGGVPAVRGGQPDVVGRGHPHLDREHDRIGQPGDGAAQFGEHAGQ